MLSERLGHFFGRGSLVYAGAAHTDTVEQIDQPGIVRMSSSGRPRRTVEAGRRRKPQAAPSGGRPRAKAPVRRRESTPAGGGLGGAPTSGGGGGTTSGSGLGGGGLPFTAGKGALSGRLTVIVVIIVIGIAVLWFTGRLGTGDGPIPPTTPSGGFGNGQLANTAPAGDFAAEYSTVPSTPGRTGQTWTVMLYQDADDKILEKDILLDLNSSGQVVSRALQQGATLTFGAQMFTWETQDAAAGEYVVGFVVEDLDGNREEAFTLITVT